MNTIFDTQNCYEGQDQEGTWTFGSYSDLYNNEEVDTETISWSEMEYEDEKRYFQDCLNQEIQAYEKRYKTSVTHIALAGKVGLWNGSPVGGTIFAADVNPLEKMGRVDDIDVTVDEDGLITLHGHHHDGSHRMNIYLLTENKMSKVTPNFYQHGDLDADEMEAIYEKLKPLKMSKVNRSGFYGLQ